VPKGVRESGGVLEQHVNDLRVRCIPALIPEEIPLDVTGLAVGDSLHVSDVRLEEGVTILVDRERAVCTVAVPRVAAAAETIEEAAEGEAAQKAPGREGESGAGGTA
jgi:large subunit ribosomal protein L25